APDPVAAALRNPRLAGHRLSVGPPPARHGRHTCAGHELHPRQLHAPGEAGADQANPHRHSCVWQRAPSAARPVLANSACTPTRRPSALSRPAPRTATETPDPRVCPAVTVTAPLSSTSPCAKSPVMNLTATTAPRGVRVSARERT